MPSLSQLRQTQFTKSSCVHYNWWIWLYVCDWWRKRRSGRAKFAPTIVDMTHDVFYTSDPDARGRCSVSVPLQANCIWGLCVWWKKKKKKDKIPQNISFCHCVVTFQSKPRPASKWVQPEFTTHGPTPSPSRHQTEDMSSRARPHLRARLLVPCCQGHSVTQWGDVHLKSAAASKVFAR